MVLLRNGLGGRGSAGLLLLFQALDQKIAFVDLVLGGGKHGGVVAGFVVQGADVEVHLPEIIIRGHAIDPRPLPGDVNAVGILRPGSRDGASAHAERLQPELLVRGKDVDRGVIGDAQLLLPQNGFGLDQLDCERRNRKKQGNESGGNPSFHPRQREEVGVFRQREMCGGRRRMGRRFGLGGRANDGGTRELWCGTGDLAEIVEGKWLGGGNRVGFMAGWVGFAGEWVCFPMDLWNRTQRFVDRMGDIVDRMSDFRNRMGRFGNRIACFGKRMVDFGNRGLNLGGDFVGRWQFL